MSLISLNTLAKNNRSYESVRQFESLSMLQERVTQTIYFDSGTLSGTRIQYNEKENGQFVINTYLVSQTISQINNLISPSPGWGYAAGISGTIVLSGGKLIKEITAIAQESSATVRINGGNIITLPYGSTDRLSTTIVLNSDNLIDPTIIFTGTKSYFVEYVV